MPSSSRDPEASLAGAHIQNLKTIEAWTRELERCARKKAWEDFERLHRRRMELVERTFATPLDPADASDAASLIRSILVLDEALRALVEAERQHLGERIEALRLGQRAQRAYGGYDE